MKNYKAVKETYEVLDCEHSMCSRFHANGCPPVTRSEWIIIDTTTGDRAEENLSGSYDLKRDAVEAIKNIEGMNK